MSFELKDVVTGAFKMRKEWEHTKEVYGMTDKDMDAYLAGITDMLVVVGNLFDPVGE